MMERIKPIDRESIGGLVGTPYYEAAYRQVRKSLLAAFDVYKENVLYGIAEETEEERAAALAWYRALLEKEPSALASVPEKILRFAEGGVGK